MTTCLSSSTRTKARRYSGALPALVVTLLAAVGCETGMEPPSEAARATGVTNEQLLAGIHKMSFIGDLDVFTMTSDGLNESNITNSSGYEQNATWSRDGTKIAFSYSPGFGGYFDVYIMDPDGSNRVNLTSTGNIDEHVSSFSPDGSKILYSKGLPDTHTETDGTWVMNADGSNRMRFMTDGGGFNWSPDGTKIVFSRSEGPVLQRRTDIWVMNADGSSQVRLTNAPIRVFNVGPEWSRDGTRILFERSWSTPDGLRSKIRVMNTDGSNRINLTNDEWSMTPTYSPDGTRIAFSHRFGSPNQGIYVMRWNGRNVVRLTSGVHDSPDWGPAVP